MSLDEKVKGLTFIQKLRTVSEIGEVDYWEDRKNPPNLFYDDFKSLIDRFETIEKLKWVSRESEQGPYGKTGEDYCFKFECEVRFGGFFEIEIKRYFLKGYFFEKSKLIGVTIQSFREV
ncbi:MAG: hypothetical protein ACOVP4_13875 [Bacteriovoracaceae bacterium]